MMRRRLCMLLLVAQTALFVGGCANLRWEPTQQVEPAEPVQPAEQDILEQLRDVQQWSPEQFKAELPVLEADYANSPTVENRLRLALALGFGRCHQCDKRRALSLFTEAVDTGGDRPLAAFAALCVDLLETQAKIAAAGKQLAKEQARVEDLQQKLDALTSIEESLHQRE